MKKKPVRVFHTINFKILVPTIFIVLAQSVTIFVILVFSIGIKTLNNSLIGDFKSSVNIRKNYMESSMSTKWSNITNYYDQFILNTKTYLDRNKEKIDDVLNNKSETDSYLLTQMDIFHEMIERNHVNDSFLVLNTSYSDNKEMVYLRAKNPLKSERSEIEVIYSPYAVFNKYYQDGFGLSNKVDTNNYKDIENKDFYEKTVEYATSHLDEDAVGYWTCTLNISSNQVLTYSMPLIYEGKVIGVIGVGLTGQYLRNYITTISKGDRVNIALIKKGNGKNQSAFEAYVDYSLPNLSDIELTSTVYENIYSFKNDGVDEYYYEDAINVYNGNSPFFDEWYLVGVAPTSIVLSASNNLGMQIGIVLGVAFLIASLVLVLSSEMVSKPIRRVSRDVNETNVTDIPKTNIYEVDALLYQIQNSYKKNIELSEKVNRIIKDSSSKMAFFEYDKEKDEVTTTTRFYSMLKLDYPNEKTSSSEFIKRLGLLERCIYSQSNKLDENALTTTSEVVFAIDSRYIQFKITPSERGSYATLIDLTDEYLSKKEIEKERDYDILTSLLNRRGFMDRVQVVMKTNLNGCLFMIDVDNLKLINDRYGHEFGDTYLRAIGSFFNDLSEKHQNLYAGHLSGDEFILYLYNWKSHDEKESLIEELKKIKKECISYRGKEIYISFSAGVCDYRENIEFEELRNRADFAMYEAKRSGKNKVVLFDDDEYDEYKKQNLLYGELNEIISKRLIDYAYQPIVDIHDGEILGYEALMRPTVPGMSPLKLIDAAKKYNRLYDIEYITFLNAIKKYSASGSDKRIFVNSISSQILSELAWGEFVEQNKGIFDKLVVEIIEEDFGQNGIMRKKVEILTSNHIDYAIDDYGTGFNSISMILNYSPKYIKIEGSLIRGIDKDEKKAQLTKTIVSYCKVNGIKVVAEAVETLDELKFVKGIGCDYIQGYLISEPKFEIEDISDDIKEMIRNS